ncbi:MAG: polyprenyl synthetase family protein, partial [Kiritimatiellae bacterium]|nr:polyprenyl synthetase family protein [Kiritimatiellia bacterium]
MKGGTENVESAQGASRGRRTIHGTRPVLPDLDSWQQHVGGWFVPAALAELLGSPATPVERLAQSWLATGGKRLRPLLAAGVHAVLSGEGVTDEARAVAVAVECFHKASLAHDDVEDNDRLRYGLPTLHVSHGVPIAINSGDYLIGEGYRLLATLPAPARVRARLLTAAAEGHRALCLGQGEELDFAAAPHPLNTGDYARICKRKTGAVFAVAGMLGAIRTDASEAVCATLTRFGHSVGLAYQIRDDLADVAQPGGGDLGALRPCILLALACESRAPDVAGAL